jgi:hypothetical protein
MVLKLVSDINLQCTQCEQQVKNESLRKT